MKLEKYIFIRILLNAHKDESGGMFHRRVWRSVNRFHFSTLSLFYSGNFSNRRTLTEDQRRDDPLEY